jgi:K+-transporting ATPase KdpF subunit
VNLSQNWDYVLWALVAFCLLVYLGYVLLRAEKF